jgi:multicomponent Na+:H+ antiporter subunit E
MKLAVSRQAAVRALGFFALWVIFTGSNPADFMAGAAAALVAAWASLHLLPTGASRLRPAALVEFVMRFLRQSTVAGIDVSRRALDPRLPLHVGFVRYPVGLSPGPSLNIFTTLTSLLPGTMPTRPDVSGALLIHCLDVEQPIAAQLAAEEALFARVIGEARRDG